MLLFLCFILIVICCIPLIKYLNSKQLINKSIIILIVVITLLIAIYLIVKFIVPILPHNQVQKEDRILLEKYILDKYGLELRVTNSTISHRGNTGINPGIEYVFTLKSNNDIKYSLDINYIEELDLKTILSRNPELSLNQMK